MQHTASEMLPIEIQMQIDISAQHHSREVAEGFAKLRERLLPGKFKCHMDAMEEGVRNFNRLLAQSNLWPTLQDQLRAFGERRDEEYLRGMANGGSPYTGTYNNCGYQAELSGSGLWPW